MTAEMSYDERMDALARFAKMEVGDLCELIGTQDHGHITAIDRTRGLVTIRWIDVEGRDARMGRVIETEEGPEAVAVIAPAEEAWPE